MPNPIPAPVPLGPLEDAISALDATRATRDELAAVEEAAATKAALADLAHETDVSLSALSGRVGEVETGKADVVAVARAQEVIDGLASTVVEKEGATLVRQAGASVFSDLVWAILDAIGRAAIGVNTAGDVVTSVARVVQKVVVGSGAEEVPVEVEGGDWNYAFAIADDAGNVILGVKDGVLLGLPDSDDVTADVLERNQTNLVKAQAVKGSLQTAIERNVHKYNHLIVYGQSLAVGEEGWPALSKTPRYGNLMLGDSVRPAWGGTAGWLPVGGANVLKPLVATVQKNDQILTDAEVAALPVGDWAYGESVCEGLANFAKRLHNDHVIQANDDDRLFVTTNNGSSGRTIEQLSKGANPELYLRLTQAVAAIKGIADGEGASYGVTGVVFMQGEWNYTTAHGGTTDRETYKSLLSKLRDDINADVAAITGQARPPAFLLYQTGAGYTRDDVLLSIGMAQWEFGRDTPGCALVGPIYPYTDKGGHLDSNGYRWFGNLVAKVYHRVVTLGQGWKPLSPIRIEAKGKSLYLDFHVPEPPLVWDLPYVVNTAQDYPAKGFRVSDAAGSIAVTAATIVADTVVRLDLSRPPGGDALVWYASQATNGGGCLRDSDATVAHDSYEYLAGSGQYPSANIPALVGKPYPMHNWCVAFCLPVTWSEP
jgi:hypothetical protein